MQDSRTHLDLLYSNSMWRQSSMPTSILMELLLSGGMRYECTHRSFSLDTSASRREMVKRTKYLLQRQFAREGDAARSPEFHVDALVTLILLLDVLEVKVERLRLAHLSRCSEFLRQGQKLMMVPSIVEELYAKRKQDALVSQSWQLTC